MLHSVCHNWGRQRSDGTIRALMHQQGGFFSLMSINGKMDPFFIAYGGSLKETNKRLFLYCCAQVTQKVQTVLSSATFISLS